MDRKKFKKRNRGWWKEFWQAFILGIIGNFFAWLIMKILFWKKKEEEDAQ